MDSYAWHLLTFVPGDLRDPVTALEFATKAVEASNEQDPYFLDTLALAQFYDSWHTAEPGKGYDAKAAEWRAKLPPDDEAAEPAP